METTWDDGFTIKVSGDGDDKVVISANREGLLSLARQLNALADEYVGCHIHYDKYNSLDDDSLDMIIEKIE